MMGRGKRDITPALLKFGFAAALSFAGFIYARLISRRTKLFPSPPPTGEDDRMDSGRKSEAMNDLHGLQMIPTSFDVESDNYEQARSLKAGADSPIASISLNSKQNGDDDKFLLPEFDELMKEFDTAPVSNEFSPRKNTQIFNADVGTPKAYSCASKDDYEQEIRHLRNVVGILRERERCLEIQLLEYYGLKEQETTVMELENRLKINNMEAKLFNLKIESLQNDNKRLEAQLADHGKVVAELEAARAKLKSLKKKLRYDAEQNKEQILILQRRVTRLQEQEDKVSDSNQDRQKHVQRLRDLENEVEGLRQSNKRLELENSDLAQRLESTQVLANSVLETGEAEELKEESRHLKERNEGLAKEVERLQADRCADVEELVYLRWLNACLRYELRNYQPQQGKTVAKDLSKSLSPKSEEKAKQLILEYANTEGMGERVDSIPDFDSDQWSNSNSQASYLTDSAELDESSFENSSAAKTSNSSSKVKFFSKLRKLVRGKPSSRLTRGSSVDKIASPEELGVTSPRYSSGVSTATDVQSSRFTSPPHGSSRLSLDIQRPRNSCIEDIKDLQSGRRNSDLVLSPAYKKLVLSEEEGDRLSPREKQFGQDMHSVQKAELVKYAEALQGNRSSKRKFHRKSFSNSSF